MMCIYSIRLRPNDGRLRYAARHCQLSLVVVEKNAGLARKERSMLWTIFVILLILWFLGLVSSYTLGGYIHLLLLVALVVLLVNLLTGRRGAV